MRRLACLAFVVVALGCNDNSHPSPLGPEVPNRGGIVVSLSVGQGVTTTTVSSSTGTGGFGSTSSTGVGFASDCDCVAAAKTPGSACAGCWSSSGQSLCQNEADICNTDPLCQDVVGCLNGCASTDYVCQKSCFFGVTVAPSANYTAYLNCLCTMCANNCTFPQSLDCSVP